MIDKLQELAPVEVLCHTIDHLHEALTLGINLEPEHIREVLEALLSIEMAIVDGRDFHKRKGE